MAEVSPRIGTFGSVGGWDGVKPGEQTLGMGGWCDRREGYRGQVQLLDFLQHRVKRSGGFHVGGGFFFAQDAEVIVILDFLQHLQELLVGEDVEFLAAFFLDDLRVAAHGRFSARILSGGGSGRSGGGGDRVGGLDAEDEFLALAGEGAEIAFHLDAVPEGVGLAEEDAEADGHGGSDGSLAEHDLVDRARRHTDGAGHRVLRDAHGLEILLQQDLPRSDGSLHEL